FGGAKFPLRGVEPAFGGAKFPLRGVEPALGGGYNIVSSRDGQNTEGKGCESEFEVHDEKGVLIIGRHLSG
ncbi:MAG: hypothetical protein ABF382_04345, partial [Akkermansiaceae bacterium]